jgi:hypothetical protein
LRRERRRRRRRRRRGRVMDATVMIRRGYRVKPRAMPGTAFSETVCSGMRESLE